MSPPEFALKARVSTESPDLVRPVLLRELPGGSIAPTGERGEFAVEARREGASARDLNRALLSALRAAEKRTRLRAEWTAEGLTERFFDYVPKGRRPATPE